MKILLFALTLTPLLTFAAAPAAKLGTIEKFMAQQRTKEQQHTQSVQNGLNRYMNSAKYVPMLDEINTKELTALFLSNLMNGKTPYIWDRAQLEFQIWAHSPKIAYHVLSLALSAQSLSEAECKFIRDSATRRLVLLHPSLDLASKERLRKAWATPTDIFPKGRNPKNLILPAANDSKDQKS